MVGKKNPTETRQIILETTAELLHQHGYKGLRVDDVVAKTGLTKGALYHHFSNKQALAYAVIDELLHNMFLGHMQELLEKEGAPLEIIVSSFECMGEDIDESDIEMGCPLTNLGQEMSFEDEGFRTRINNVFELWINLIAKLINDGITQGSIKAETHPEKAARFLVSAFQGIQCNSKYGKDICHFQDNLKYLQSVIHGFAV